MRALLMSHAQGNVDHKLKEIMRILLARFASDKYFASLRSSKARAMGLTETRIDEGCFAYEDDSKGFSEAEKCALRYADLMFLDANQIDKAFYDEMKTALERGTNHGARRLHRLPLRHGDVHALAGSEGGRLVQDPKADVGRAMCGTKSRLARYQGPSLH